MKDVVGQLVLLIIIMAPLSLALAVMAGAFGAIIFNRILERRSDESSNRKTSKHDEIP